MLIPCACTTVRKANRALFRFYEDAMNGTGVSITQFAIMRALDRNGETALSDLASELVMERTSLYRTIAPLEKSGAIKIQHSGTGRIKLASLTPKGTRQMQEAEPHWERAQATVVGAIGAKEWRALSQALLEIPTLLEVQS